MTEDLRPLHRAALAQADAVVRDIPEAAWARPTPCAGWDLRALLGHLIGQHIGFAAAVTDGDAPVSAYEPRPVSDWAASVRALRDAFAAASLEREVVLAEFHPTLGFAVSRVVGFHLLDTVVHTWDVATTLGRTYRPPDDLLAAAAAVSAAVPAGAARERPGAAFGPALAVDADSDPWAAVLAHLGRDPGR